MNPTESDLAARELVGPGARGLRASLSAPDLTERRRELLQLIDKEEDPELLLSLAYLDYLSHDFETSRRHAEAAYRGLRQHGNLRRAALAAAAVGRIHFEGFNNHAAARGWFARGRTLLEGEGECVERGWVELGLVGCSVTNVSELADKAASVARLARRLGDVDLECKALADQGLALVSLGQVKDGMELIDEAMAMVTSGEVQPFAAAQVVCCTLTACERTGELAQADAWMRALEQAGVGGPDEQPATIFAHCRAAYGNLLCQVGRWAAAETSLRASMAAARSGFYMTRVGARAGLAELRIRQGRLEEAAQLLAECGERWEAMPPRARLHHARREYDLAAAVIKRAVREIGEDQARGVPLLVLLVDTELGRENVEAARKIAARVTEMAAASGLRSLSAQAALARGRVCAAEGSMVAAAAEFEAGLSAFVDINLPPLKAALELNLARALAEFDRDGAISEAGAALRAYEALGAPEAEQAVSLLRRLGVNVSYRPPQRRSPLDELSRREREVLQLLAQGMSNPEIARRLFISPKTAEHHVSSILSKLGLRSRFEASTLDLLA